MNNYLLRNGLYVTIRSGLVADVTNLTFFIDKCAGQSDFLTFDQGEYITNNAQRDVIIELSQEKNGLFLVAEISGEIVGTLTFRRGKRPKISHGGEFGIIVEQGYWRMGIGKILIQELIRWAKQSDGVRKINLNARKDNERAIALYKALGFVEEGRLVRDFCSKGIFYDTLIMGICIN